MTKRKMIEDTAIGGITWHSSEVDGGPDVGISVYLGDENRLWIGEVTDSLFCQSGKEHFSSDGGWFLVWYKPEPVLIAKCADDLDARDFIEHIASMLRLSAQQREPVVRVKDILDCSVRLDGCSSNEPTIREMVENYYLTGIPHDAEYARSCAARFMAAIEIQSSDGSVEGHAGDAKQATGAAVTGAPPTSGDTISPTDLLAAGVESGPSEAIADIAAERRRQIEVEGWTPEHDAAHDMGELARAAICYADPLNEVREQPPAKWPWSSEWWRPKDRRRDLVRAGALIVAEIERLDRLASSGRR